MKCPKCKDISLRKKSDFNSPFSCNKCGGIWLEYDKIPDFMENLGSSPVISDNVLNQQDGITGLCPSGHGIMIRAKIDIDNPFFLEKCGTCGGVWFDKGEWQRIVDNDLTDMINDFWCKSWQSNQRKEKDRKNYLDTNRKLFGNELFDDLMKLSKALKEHPEKGRAIALLQHEIIK